MRPRRVLGRLALACGLVAVLAISPLAAQSYQGGVRGQVRDAAGVIQGAEVTLVEQTTNARRTTATNDVGEYVFPNVLPGTYIVTVATAGFRPAERRDLAVGTDRTIIADFLLEPATLTEAIVVTSEQDVLERSTASMGAALRSDTLDRLPLFGRNTFYLSIFTPAVVQSGDPQFVRLQDQSGSSLLSVAGGPRRGNSYLVEGVPIMDLLNRATFVPSIEAVEELKVQVRTYDAEMGRSAGGVFNTTAKSGSNAWHGSALFITKPGWATGHLYFPKRAGVPKPSQYFYDWGGSIGGPIRRDRTFLWFSTEGYQQKSTRGVALTLPTAAERAGDFSRTVDAQGRPVLIYDPLTTRPDPGRPGLFVRDPFPGNVIPADRIDTVARAMLSTLPLPTSGKGFTAVASLVDGPQDQETLKVDHHWNTRWTTTAMYAHQHTKEPGTPLFGEHGSVPGDPGSNVLFRTIHFVAVNNVFVPTDSTAVAVRYGYNRFFDDGLNYPAFDAATLGLPARYVDALTFNTFPAIAVAGYFTMGNQGPTRVSHRSQTISGTLTRAAGHHTVKAGGDFRRLSANVIEYGVSAGGFEFTPGFTQGPDPNTASTTAGDAFASFLLGYPAVGSVQVATPGRYYVDSYSAFVHDDYRLSPDLTLNLGLRYERELGARERDNQFTVGFDRDAPFPVQVPGLDLRGGLMYAGVAEYPERQGASQDHAFAPRAGLAWSASPRTVVRGGYGWFWVPTQYGGTSEGAMGTRGYSASTSLLSSTDGGLTPAGRLHDPFPGGVTQPQGNLLGLLTGAGGTVDFVDQHSKRGYVHQYSVELQRELPGRSMLSLAYLGSRGERLGIGGTVDATVNVNQLDPRYLALGAALQEPVPNPFFGNSAFGNFSVSPTIARGQLLRPFPQFDHVLAHRVNQARSRYHAIATQWNRRFADDWGLTANYTWSRLMDSQFGETNTYSSRPAGALNNYDLEAEFSRSLLDVPHRLNFYTTMLLPFGEGRRWLSGRGIANAVLGGWSVTVAGRYQSGFPVAVGQASNNSGLFGSGQRSNVVPGVDPATSGSTDERLARWLNPAAWAPAAPFTFGNAPRTDTRVRTPGQRNSDLSIQKSHRIGGRNVAVRADILNLFDDPLFIGPATSVGATSFGQITDVAGFARSLQLHVRVGW